MAATVFCRPQNVDLSVVNGRVVVEGSELQTLELPPVIERHNRIAERLVRGA
jgi:hypothetical protein